MTLEQPLRYQYHHDYQDGPLNRPDCEGAPRGATRWLVWATSVGHPVILGDPR